MKGWARDVEGGCRITVRVSPRASRAGVAAEVHGVTIRVHAPPVGGRATREAGQRLAEALGVPRSRVGLQIGATSREKVYGVTGMSASEAVRRLLRPP